MFKCKDCGNVFDEPATKEMEKDTGYQECACPYCGSDYYVSAKLCPICKQEYTDQDFCESCCEKVRLVLNDLKERLGADQNDFEDIIANHFGW